MISRTRGLSRTLTFAFAMAAVSCTSDAGSTESSQEAVADETIPEATAVQDGPQPSSLTPSEMCGTDGVVAVTAYDLANGSLKWAACSSNEIARRSVLDVSDEAVYLETIEPNTGAQQLIAYDAADGTELPNGGPVANQPTLPDRTVPSPNFVVVDGIRVQGGQSGPTTARDDATGDVLWTQPGSTVYDDVWAVGGGAVYLMKQGSASGLGALVAYELTSGDVRWLIEPAPADVWPWHADDERLFAIWTNLALISTDDGSTTWRTEYPDVPFPRMTGVMANSDTVFVAFSSTPSGGD